MNGNIARILLAILLAGCASEQPAPMKSQVENVERIMAKEHKSVKEATIMAMEQISGALVAVVMVMASVFIPAAFLPGTTGQLYKQFAITIVISVAISASWPSP